jgi:hypothetical protein
MSSNGLLASTDVCATGSPASNFFVRVGDAVVIPDPLQIVSPDGSETLSIGIANSGVAAISGASSLGVGTLVGGVSSFTVAANGDVATLGTIDAEGAITTTAGLLTNVIAGLAPGDTVGIGADVNITGSLDATSAAIDGTLQANTGAFNNITQAISVLNISATGGINVASDMTVSGGSLLQVSGGSGTARVFDPVYNPVSVVTSAAIVVNSPAAIDLPNTGAANLLTIPIPAAGQNAMIFDVALNLTMEYQTASSLNQNMYLYLTPTSEGAIDFTKAVPSVSYSNGNNNQVLTLTPITNNGVIEFTIQGSILRFYNTTGAAVSNLYLAMGWTGQGSPPSIGNLTDVNIYALVECRKGVFVAPA